MASIIGVIFFLVGVAVTINSAMKKAKYTGVTKGVVVDISREVSTTTNDYSNLDSRNRMRYNTIAGKEITLYPIVEYTVGENKYVKKSNTSSNNSFVGKEVTVHYDPEDPEKSYFNSNIGTFVVGITFAIVGAVAFVLSITSK